MHSIVQRLSQSIGSAQTLSGITRPLLEMLVELTDLESAYLTTVDEARGVQNVIYSLNTGELNLPEGLEVPWEDTLCKRALDEGRMYTGNVAECWGDSGAARELGIQTYVSTPVRFASGSLYGTLCAASRQSAQMPQDAESALRLFAKIIAGFAEREQLLLSLQQANRELSSLVLLDALTGLPNRRGLTEELRRAIAQCRRNREWVLVGFLDLDKFKQINDQHGHEAGDALLCSLGKQLAASVRSSDMLARFGGDEFVIVGSGPSLNDDGAVVARELQQRLAAASAITLSLSRGRELVYQGASVAVISLSPDQTDVDDALQKADAAMYRIKAERQQRAAAAMH